MIHCCVGVWMLHDGRGWVGQMKMRGGSVSEGRKREEGRMRKREICLRIFG